MHRFGPRYLLAMAWAYMQVRRARRLVGAALPCPGALTPPPAMVGDDPRPVRSVLHRTRSTCLVRSLVQQAWEAGHGVERDIIIGVTGTADFQAHAWLEGDPAEPTDRFTELVRLPARGTRR